MISPATVSESSFGGVSTADITRSAGRPLITYDTPPLRDALGATNQLFCPEGDPKAMTEAIIRCFEDEAYIDKIYEESILLCEMNEMMKYMAYLLSVGCSWQAPLS